MDGAIADADRQITDQVKVVYGEAAQVAKGLCCPKPMPPGLTDHIPPEAFDHSYGCGTPIATAGVRPGETVVDLGSGVGIDCFVAAKLVGSTGRVIGVDMTDEMLAKAYGYNSAVARNLGYNVVEFRKATIEHLPIENGSVDLLVSNCVFNLSTDKKRVFQEVSRVLRHGGRVVISDVVSDRDIREEDRQDPAEWAECTTGTMSLRAFLEAFKAAGFVGLRQISEEGWREIHGYHLSSITLEAYKFETDCHAGMSHLAIYLGPYAEVKDDLGNSYPRFKPVAVRSDVAAFLEKGGDRNSFIVIAGRPAAKARPVQPAAEQRASPCCDPKDEAAPCCENRDPKPDGSPCCDPLALQQPPDCPCGTGEGSSSCGAPAAAAAPVKAEASACCDSSSGCGTGSGCGTPADAKPTTTASMLGAEDEAECCACETEAQKTGTECCGAGCGTCGCE